MGFPFGELPLLLLNIIESENLSENITKLFLIGGLIFHFDKRWQNCIVYIIKDKDTIVEARVSITAS